MTNVIWEANSIASRLAKEALCQLGERVWMEEVSRYVQDIVLAVIVVISLLPIMKSIS